MEPHLRMAGAGVTDQEKTLRAMSSLLCSIVIALGVMMLIQTCQAKELRRIADAAERAYPAPEKP